MFDIEVGSGVIALRELSVWVPRVGTGGLVLIAGDPLLKGQQGAVLPVLLPTQAAQTPRHKGGEEMFNWQ